MVTALIVSMALVAVLAFSLGFACVAVAYREDQIRRAWRQRREACIYWLNHPESDLPETYRE